MCWGRERVDLAWNQHLSTDFLSCTTAHETLARLVAALLKTLEMCFTQQVNDNRDDEDDTARWEIGKLHTLTHRKDY